MTTAGSTPGYLGATFGDAAASYADRPDYATAAARWALERAPGPRVLDIGAGTGDPGRPREHAADGRRKRAWHQVQQLGSGLLVSVVDDVDHVPVWIAHEEPADAPRFIGQRMNDLVAAALRFRVGLVDVAPDVH